MERYDVNIKGMSCDSCRINVERVIKSFPTLEDVHVSLVSGTANFLMDPNQVYVQDIFDALDKIGYKASFADDDYLGKLQEKEKELQNKKISVIMVFGLTVIIFLLSMVGVVRKGLVVFGVDYNSAFLTDAILQMILCIIILYLGKDLLKSGWISLIHLRPNMYSLITIGTFSGFLFSIVSLGYYIYKGEAQPYLFFDAGAGIMAFVMLGKFVEGIGNKKAMSSLVTLLGNKPQIALLLKEDGSIEDISVQDIKKGDMLLVKPGQQIPSDAVVVSGSSEVDEALITGESIPMLKKVGDSVLAGTINTNAPLRVKATSNTQESYFSKVISILNNISSQKTGLVLLVDKISFYFIPAVFLLAFISGIFWYIHGQDFILALKTFMTVLVVACPCALGLATPLAVTIFVFQSAKAGFIVTNGGIFSTLKHINHLCFDKTGTLTQGSPTVTHFFPLIKPEEPFYKDLLRYVYILESQSFHPLSRALVSYISSQEVLTHEVSLAINNFSIIPGEGLQGEIEGVLVRIGNEKLIDISNLEPVVKNEYETLLKQGEIILFVELDHKLAAIFTFKDQLKQNAKEMIEFFQNRKYEISILSGDHDDTVKILADKLNIKNYYGRMTPETKRELIESLQDKGESVFMIGDGFNDTLALQQADLSLCMGQGSDTSLKISSIIFNKVDLKQIPTFFRYMDKTHKIIKQNLFWAFIYNVISIPIAMGLLMLIAGITFNPVIGVIGMSLSSMIVVLNSLRLLLDLKNLN
jgi:Cu+-exporting ATPase